MSDAPLLPWDDDGDLADLPELVPPPPGPALSPEAVESFDLTTGPADVGQRLDVYLAAALPGVSRSRIRRAIDQGLVRLDGEPPKASFKLEAVHRVAGQIPAAAEGPHPEPIPLTVLLEDEHLVVVDKPPGMVVHPAKGHWAGTLASALVHRFGQLSTTGGAARPGIVHRLDRDTSGVIVVAKHDAAHTELARQFHDRTVQKEYLAIGAGRLDRDRGLIDRAIGPPPTHRGKMALRPEHPDSRPAQTFYEAVERYPGFALVRAQPKTGRTHQIRLHLAHVGVPVLCDRLYGGRAKITLGELRAITRCKRLGAGQADSWVMLERQALHAHRIAFTHPATGKPVEATAPLPADLQAVVSVLRESRELG